MFKRGDIVYNIADDDKLPRIILGEIMAGMYPFHVYQTIRAEFWDKETGTLDASALSFIVELKEEFLRPIEESKKERYIAAYGGNSSKRGEPENDMVKHPNHYTAGGIETRDFLKAKLNAMPHLTPWQAYCIGTAMKYPTRAGLKDMAKFKEDLKKAITYLEWAIEDEV